MEPLSCCSFQGSVAGIPPKRQTRSTRVSKKAVTSPSQLPSELPTTLAPTPLALPLPLPLKQPTPTPSDVDVDMLVGGGEYILPDSAQDLLVCSPFNKLSPPADDIQSIQHPAQSTTTISRERLHPSLDIITQDSFRPSPHSPHSPRHTNTRTTTPSVLSVPALIGTPTEMELDLKLIPPHDLAGLVSLDEQQPINLISPIQTAGKVRGSPKSVISISGIYFAISCCPRN